MAINLASKYEAAVLNKWIGSSYIAGKLSNKYNFAGVRSINIYSPISVALQDYNRAASVGARFGTTTELTDEVQELSMSQDKSFSISIDKGNNVDQLNIKGAGDMLKLEIDEQLAPFTDQYTIAKLAREGGKVVIAGATIAKGTIVGLIADCDTWFTNNFVPIEGRHMLISATHFNLLRLATEFLAVDQLAAKALGKGVVGECMGFTITKVPDSYLPTDLAFLAFHKDSGLNPFKIKTLRILTDVAGLDGSLLEGRQYFDAFVLGKKANGIYACLANGSTAQVATPAIVDGVAPSHTITCATGSAVIKYTLDGTDPRYSKSAVTYSGAFDAGAGVTINACASKTAMYGSNLATPNVNT
jgi:hypothetical protein